jgi:phosphoserine phosphatase
VTAQVWLVRHGATLAPGGVAIGSSDPALSEVGRTQAAGLAEQLASRPLTRVFSSDLARALQTAQVIAKRHGLPVEVVPALREIDFGAWEGRPLSGLWTDERDAAHAWEADIRSTPPSFSESFDDLERRVLEWWRTVQPALTGEVAIVAHRGSLAVLAAAITGCSIEAAFAERVDPGAMRSAVDDRHVERAVKQDDEEA